MCPISHQLLTLALAISMHAQGLGGRKEERRLVESQPRILLTRADLGVDSFLLKTQTGFVLVMMTIVMMTTSKIFFY